MWDSRGQDRAQGVNGYRMRWGQILAWYDEPSKNEHSNNSPRLDFSGSLSVYGSCNRIRTLSVMCVRSSSLRVVQCTQPVGCTPGP